MGENSGIQWCDNTWNPWQGCQKVSPGCDNCYMFRDKKRYGQDPETVVRSKPPTFNRPRRWNKEAEAAGQRRLVFTASWADFFSREADEWRPEAWALIAECPWLTFQILTKRHARIADNLPPDWGDGYPNVWLGVSAENQEWWGRRTTALRAVPARVRWVSVEPQIGSINPGDLRGIDWVVVGGESGPNERPFLVGWAEHFIAAGMDARVPIFVKQLGSHPIGFDGERLRLKDSHGGEMDEWPEHLRVRAFPEVRHG